MAGLWLILAGVGGVGLFIIEVLRYGLPKYKDWKVRKESERKNKLTVKYWLEEAIQVADEYKFDLLQEGIQKLVDDPLLPKKLRRDLSELEELLVQCSRWLNEGRRIIRMEAELVIKEFRELDESCRSVMGLPLGLSLAYAFEGLRQCNIAIYEGNLTFELVRDHILQDRWDSKVQVRDKVSGEQKEARFRDVIEGKEFHKFVDELKKLEDRESIKRLRNLKTQFIDRVEAMLKEV